MKRRIHLLSFSLVLLYSSSLCAYGAKTVFERKKPHVNVGTIGHVVVGDPALAFDFQARIQFAPARPPSGGLHVALADGSVRFYQATAGAVLEGQECLVFFLGGRDSGELDPNDPAIAIFNEDPARPGVILVKLQMTRAFPQILAFELPGEISAATSGARPPANQWFTTYYWHFRFDYPRQLVAIKGTDEVAGFAASAKVLQDHFARGFVALDLPDSEQPLLFETLLGAAVRPSATGPGYIVILMAAEGAPLEIENMAMATIRPDPAVPGCDIWDFTSNVVTRRGAPWRFVFDAEGTTRFYGRNDGLAGPK